jgi:hypothetical protein
MRSSQNAPQRKFTAQGRKPSSGRSFPSLHRSVQKHSAIYVRCISLFMLLFSYCIVQICG